MATFTKPPCFLESDLEVISIQENIFIQPGLRFSTIETFSESGC